jgi:diketogulonate reductase-like aldo/keto reductase
MEAALKAGQCRFIGVSNYSAELLLEMQSYAQVMPAVNQLELHPRFASPRLREVCKELGVALTGYGTGNSVNIESDQSGVSPFPIAAIAERIGKTAMDVVARWTVQSGVALIPRSGDPDHIRANRAVFDFELSTEDMAAIDAMDEDHPYYWSPVPSNNTLRDAHPASIMQFA